MDVFVNNELQTIEENSNLIQLMEIIDMAEKKGIAVAINNAVVSKTKWREYQLHSNDKIIIIRATQGG
jgi:sulfur carrier protein